MQRPWRNRGARSGGHGLIAVTALLAAACTGGASGGGQADGNGGTGASSPGGSSSGGASGSGAMAGGGTSIGGTAGNGGTATGSGGTGTGGTSIGGTAGNGGTATGGTGNSMPECAVEGAIASLGEPFQSASDNNGPDSFGSLYGDRPRIVARPRGDGSFDVAWLDHGPETESERGIWITHVEPTGDGYEAAWHTQLDGLGTLAGFALAGSDYVVLTALSEDISDSVEPEEIHRDGILQLVRVDTTACTETYRVDLRTDYDGDSDRMPIYQPMVAGTSRLEVTGSRYAIHYSQHTEYDPGVSSRHQTGRFFVGSADTGAMDGVGNGVSHSFDQRMFAVDGAFIAAELGDASHRGIAATHLAAADGDLDRRTAFAIKGGDSATGGGYNNTFTRLGNISQAPNGYALVFVSEDETDYTIDRVNAARNVALVHLQSEFWTVDTNEDYDTAAVDTETGNESTDSFPVTILDYWGDGFNPTNVGVAWLTSYTDVDTEHAERPKLVRVNDSQFIVLWEHWTLDDYVETRAIVVDEWGNTVVPAGSIGGARLHRGDDAFALAGKAAWVTGDAGKLVLHTVGPDLGYVAHDL